MRVAVVSDIHANYHALTAVLAAIDAEEPDEVWCLGDTIGYGPQPNECCALVERRAVMCLTGNHDLAVIGAIPSLDFNGDAAEAVEWTQSVLGGEARRFLGVLGSTCWREGVLLCHGSPLDPVWDYVLTGEGARRCFEVTEAPLILVGHSHVQLALSWDGGRIGGGLAEDGDEVDLSTARWLLNPGSVGQPRAEDPRAAWMVLDLDTRRASFRRTPYAVAETQAEMRALGLPEALAARLERGV